MATDGASPARRTRSPRWCPASRRAPPSDWRRSSTRWRRGCSSRACASDVNWRRFGYHALLGVALALVIGRVVAGVLADLLWYDAMGATSLWQEKAIARLLLDGG